jgi:hypothetical protein
VMTLDKLCCLPYELPRVLCSSRPWARPHRRRSAAALGVLDHLRNLRQLLFRRQLPETGNYTESCVLGEGTPN